MTPEERADVVAMVAINATASMFAATAIVAALAEARLIDPSKVAAWAETFAAVPSTMPDEVRTGVAEQLQSFAGMLRSGATVPAGAGRA